MVYPDFKIELAIDRFGGIFDPAIFDPAIFDTTISIIDPDTWTDVTAENDVIGDVTCEYGIRTNDPGVRVAESGHLKFTLDNSEQNAGGQLGWYSIFNALRRNYFDLNIPVRFSVSCPEVNGGTPYYKFQGTLADAPATPGANYERRVPCTALDIFYDYSRNDEPELATQYAKRYDQILTTILDALTVQPLTRSLETGSETYTYALDGGTGQKLKVRERIQQLLLSEFGFCYQKGSDAGVVFQTENRSHRALNGTVLFTLDNSMVPYGAPVPTSRGELYSKVQVTVFPTNDVAGASVIVLYSAQSATILVQPGETNTTIFGPYRDPISNEQIGGDTSSMADPVATTDWTANTLEDGTGTNATADFVVTTSRTGQGVRFSITNNGLVPAYVIKPQQRGKPIYRYEALIEQSLSTIYGEKVLSFVMPFQNSAIIGRSVMQLLAATHAAPTANTPYVRFLANLNASFMEAALVREPGDRVAVKEALTGLDREFTINGVRLEFIEKVLWCTWFLEPAVDVMISYIGSSAGVHNLRTGPLELTAGSYTFTINMPATVRIKGTSGGGGGGGRPSAVVVSSQGGGGGAKNTTGNTNSLTNTETYTVVVGASGAAGAFDTAGSDGGDTKFTRPFSGTEFWLSGGKGGTVGASTGGQAGQFLAGSNGVDGGAGGNAALTDNANGGNGAGTSTPGGGGGGGAGSGASSGGTGGTGGNSGSPGAAGSSGDGGFGAPGAGVSVVGATGTFGGGGGGAGGSMVQNGGVASAGQNGIMVISLESLP